MTCATACRRGFRLNRCQTRPMSNGRIVYSTGPGRLCRSARGRSPSAVADAASRTTVSHAEGDGVVRVGRETRGRKGKASPGQGPAARGRRARRARHAPQEALRLGGTVHEGIVEIQGDHRTRWSQSSASSATRSSAPAAEPARDASQQVPRRDRRLLAPRGRPVDRGRRVTVNARGRCSARRSTRATRCASNGSRWREAEAHLPRTQQTCRHRVHDRSRRPGTSSTSSLPGAHLSHRPARQGLRGTHPAHNDGDIVNTCCAPRTSTRRNTSSPWTDP